MPQRIVDAHIHVWSPDRGKYPWAPGFAARDMWLPSFTPEDHFRYSGQLGKARINLVQITWYGLDHRYIIDLIESDPDTFVGTGIVPAVSDVSLGSPDRVMRDLSRCGIYAFRVRGSSAQADWGQSQRWLDQVGYERMFAAGAEENLALSFLIGPGDLAELDRMCERFPETPVIVDHMGGVRVRDGVVDDLHLEALRQLARHPRVMVKLGPIHGLGNGKAPFLDVLSLLRPVIAAFGAERCMWESDSGGPVLMKDSARDYVASVDLIRSAGFLSDQEKDMVLGGTAEAFFFTR
jgi:predicted TIM-barrel fold metal-dependent hydrolase